MVMELLIIDVKPSNQFCARLCPYHCISLFPLVKVPFKPLLSKKKKAFKSSMVCVQADIPITEECHKICFVVFAV